MMGLIDRIKKWRGYDTTEEVTYEREYYQYEVLHLNGNVTEEQAHQHTRDEGFLLLEEADDDTWARATTYRDFVEACKPFHGGHDVVRELEGVQEVNREKIGEHTWTITVDYATHSIENVERSFQSND